MSKPIVTAHNLEFELFITAEQIRERIREMGAELTQKYRGQNPLFLGILNGAFIFTADLVRACEMDCEINFVKIASYAGLESTGRARTLIGLETPIAGRTILLVEDIVDSGRTLSELLPNLRAQSPRSLEVVTLFYKPDAMIHPLDLPYIGFTIPDKFIIGYGLDYDGLGRNLPDIYQLKA